MKIEVGKSYVTRSGEIADIERKHEPLDELNSDRSQYRFFTGRIRGAAEFTSWNEGGLSLAKSTHLDLVAPHIEPQKPIVLQPGPESAAVPSEAEVWAQSIRAFFASTHRVQIKGENVAAVEFADFVASEYRKRYLKS